MKTTAVMDIYKYTKQSTPILIEVRSYARIQEIVEGIESGTSSFCNDYIPKELARTLETKKIAYIYLSGFGTFRFVEPINAPNYNVFILYDEAFARAIGI